MRITNTSRGTRIIPNKKGKPVVIPPGQTVNADISDVMAHRIVGPNRALREAGEYQRHKDRESRSNSIGPIGGRAAVRGNITDTSSTGTGRDLDAERPFKDLIEEDARGDLSEADMHARAKDLLKDEYPTGRKPNKRKVLDLLWSHVSDRPE